MSDRKREEFLNRLSQTPQFKELQRKFNEAKESTRQNLKQKWDSNAEQQRKASLSKDQRSREAIEQMVSKIKEFNDYRTGRDTSESAAREKAVKLAERSDRQKGE